MLLTMFLTLLTIVQFNQFKKLVEHIKNDRSVAHLILAELCTFPRKKLACWVLYLV